MIHDPADLDATARRYLDLWQEQWAGFVNNPETASQVSRMMAMMSPAGGPLSRLFDPEASHAQSPPSPSTRRHTGAKTTAPPPPAAGDAPHAEARAEATAAALQSLIGSVVELARRVDTLGQRLERLEQAPPPDTGKRAQPVRRPAQRKSGAKAVAGKPEGQRSGAGERGPRKTGPLPRWR